MKAYARIQEMFWMILRNFSGLRRMVSATTFLRYLAKTIELEIVQLILSALNYWT